MWAIMAAALVFAAVNAVDKYLISGAAVGLPPGALLAVSGLISIPFALVLGTVREPWRDAPAGSLAAAMLAGLLLAAAYYMYFRAVARAPVVTVTLLLQLVVVFNLALGWTALDEHPGPAQLGGALLVMLTSAAAVVVSNGEGGFRLDWRTLGLMSFSSLLFSLSEAAFKTASLRAGYLTAQTAVLACSALVAIALTAGHGSTRRAVARLARHGAAWLAAGSELANLAGLSLLGYALTIAPIALVQAAAGMQQVYLLAAGVLLARWAPWLKAGGGWGVHAVRVACVAAAPAGVWLAFR